MTTYKFTPYFENEVLRKRPYLKKEWCIQVLENPLRSELQEKNRFRFWGVHNVWVVNFQLIGFSAHIALL